MYLVMRLNEHQKIRVPTVGNELVFELKLEWADGMCGAMAVFEKRKDAEKYANGQEVIEVGLIKKENNNAR